MTVNGGRGEGNSRAGSPGVERRCRGVASNNSIAVDENNSEKERKCSPHQRRPGEGEEKLGGGIPVLVGLIYLADVADSQALAQWNPHFQVHSTFPLFKHSERTTPLW